MRRLLALAVVFAVVAACGPDPLPGYVRASADEHATLVAVVREYYTLLDRAQVSGDLAPLYALHPRLRNGEDRARGVNTESFTVERARALQLKDAHTELESYEPMRAFVKGAAGVVYVHGLFTWTYANGSETKGELPTRLDLERDGARWTVVRTDERVLGETPPPTPR